ncbi:heterokaryon incompatibility protein-domain-containing protein [Rhexocercosporidium sp. MPI-PUGE-AT-0058]|nr:heterokaryon incompatibility protein-domain-containing protein [Rhexocercosporidium sp. MPI-PUGE-AT-0058]
MKETEIATGMIDIEIYRPRQDADQTTASNFLSPLVEHMGFAEEIPGNARDEESFEFIKERVESFNVEDYSMPLLPDRVIWIAAKNAAGIQLLEQKDIRAKYIALSYCWGPVSPGTYLTNSSTFNSRKAGIKYTDLPPLFQDVVDISRELGIEYIWIDRLCIIQGDAHDFSTQAPKMGEIYGRATLTIAAAAAASENDPILTVRENQFLAHKIDMKVEGVGSLPIRMRQRTHLLGTEHTGGDYGKVSTRAWIWQERLLSGRTVFFTPSALKFECHCHSVWEGFDAGTIGHSWSSKLENISHVSWTSLVEEYTSREITRASDRLPAIDAVMNRIAQSTGWSPVWESQSMIYDLEVQSVDRETGLLTAACHLFSVPLNCRVERNDDDTEDKFRYHYEVIDESGIGPPLTIWPDVALKPWAGHIAGRYTTAAIRVPYGESPPEKSWNASVVCILVGQRQRRCQVLFLGGSLRNSVAWERLGTSSAILSTAFDMSLETVTLKII